MIKRNIFLIMMGIMTLSLAGCRTSPVLEQIVYEQNHTQDEDNESEDNEPDNTEQDEQLASMEQVDEAESKRDQEQNRPVSGNNTTNQNPAYTSQYRENAQTNGTDQTAPDQQTNPSGTTDGGGNDQNGADHDQGNTGGGDNGYTPSDDKNTKQIVDARGVTVSVPETVNGVTAPGEIGIMVGMLGGSERLVGSSQSLTGNSMAQSAFGTGLSNVQTWWSGDGTGTISASDFQALLSAKPDVCFEISGSNTFSQDQVTQLENAGIAYVVLPKPDSFDHIKEAVTLVGTVLGDRSGDGGKNAPAIAQQYASWVDKVTGIVGNGSAGKSTIYISSWDDTAAWEISSSQYGVYQSGTGAAVAAVSAGNMSLSASMQLAGVSNNGLDATYANPLQDGAWLQRISGTQGSQNRNYNLLSDLYTGVCLGEENFPAVVVANTAIRDHLRSDIHWQVYGKIQNGPYSTDYGFMAGSEFVKSVIHADYDIYVNPTGLGSWTNGYVESPLEAAWLSGKFQGGCSMDEVRSLVSEFYSTFYQMDVNTGTILGE